MPPGAWPNWVMGSHDAPRIAGRIGEAQARVAAMLLLTLRGTPTLYQGDELGIGRVTIPADRIRDPQDLRQPGLGVGRDASRTPMAWDRSAHAGFSTAEPWLPFHEDWPLRNVIRQDQNPHSMLALYRRLLALRRRHAALNSGHFTLIPSEPGVLQYERYTNDERLMVVLNFTAEARSLIIPDESLISETLISTLPERSERTGLAANEGVILRLQKT
ncbi:alpha-amylase family glycosyl hydrolase [Asticcacaulis sp. AND118]|uniref:alpha-amylase family glycosyl hydrolase n=1 Tax=Asticcacaulis sp. AND118 TaxID=2840468 RepID=UPI00351D53A5